MSRTYVTATWLSFLLVGMLLVGGCAGAQSAAANTMGLLAKIAKNLAEAGQEKPGTAQRSAAPNPRSSPSRAAPSTGDQWPPAGWTRNFAVGFTPIPKQPVSTEGWLEAWDELLKHHAEFVLNHVGIDWEAFLESPDPGSFNELEGLKFATGMAKRNQLDVFFVLDPLARNRVDLDPKLPKSIGRTFGDDRVRRAFTHCAIRIARDYQPTYLALISEGNTYLARHREDAESFYSLVRETVKAVKRVSPRTQVTATFQYEGLTGTFDGTSQWEILKQLEPDLDVVAISTYPSPYFAGPDAIPTDYYTQLARYTSKPILIAESGWPTGGKRAFRGSEENQDAFVRRFVELTAELDVRLWIYWFLHDWAGEGYPDFFKSMGLRTSRGTPKPAWRTWQQMVARPVQ